MIRICTSLANNGYKIILVGRNLKRSIPLVPQPFVQKRLKCLFSKGKFFYAEYNLRLIFFLLFKKMGGICAIDLDTILPCLFISTLKSTKRIYDAHELFCEMKEIVTRPRVYKTWKRIEKYSVPKFKKGYTVNQIIASEFKKMYNVDYNVIRSIALMKPLEVSTTKEKYILYQGAVNEGRSFETLIPAMKEVDAQLIICGDGNFMKNAQKLVKQNNLENKVMLKGKLAPEELYAYTITAWIGITLFDAEGLSNYYSLANRFFDYIQAAVPQLCVDFPAYREINSRYEVALLVSDCNTQNIAVQLNELLVNGELHERLRQNCLQAREIFNWQNEEKNLLHFYKNIFG
ncbi:MAG: glycosyltransferase [Chitinophagaceae bacterium]|nr:glycosyltransferase [Chitinophagaceae bacterium]